LPKSGQAQASVELGIETTGKRAKVPDRKILPGLFEWFDPAQRQALREIELFQDQAAKRAAARIA
jgi:hypothetical protein